MRAYLQIAGAVFGAIAGLHLVRVLLGWPAEVAGWSVPLWTSWIGILAAGALSASAFRLVDQAITASKAVSAEAETAAIDEALKQCSQLFSDDQNAGTVGLLRFLNEQVLREQEIFWQRFYAFATLHAGAFVLYSSDAVKRKTPIAAAGLALGVVWLYTQWASLHYANRPKKLYHAVCRKLGISWGVGRPGLFARWFGERPWASSTNAGVLTALFVAAVWLYMLLAG